MTPQTETLPKMLADLLESDSDGVCLFDSDWRYLASNQSYRMLNEPFCGPLVTGRSLMDIAFALVENGFYALPRDAASRFARSLADVASSHGQSPRLVVPLGDGRRIEVSSFLGSGQTRVVRTKLLSGAPAAAVEDGGEPSLTDLLEAVDDAIAVLDSSGRFVTYNSRLVDLLFRSEVPPQHLEAWEHAMDRLDTGGAFAGPSDKTRCLSAFRDYARAVELGLSGERTALVSAFPMRNGSRVLIFSDITDQRQMEQELRRRNEQAHQSEKLSALGELLAGVAHELNNPLSIVSGYALMLVDEAEGETAEMARKIAAAADRCSRIVRMFLSMARQRPTSLSTHAVADLVATAFEVGGYGLRVSGIAVELDIPEELPAVRADRDQMAQVIGNLLVNAQHALRDIADPRVRITASAGRKEVLVRIVDNGPGVPHTLRDRIFEPFFTTKGEGVGTGVGLAFCHRILEGHGGQIELLDSDTGAAFQLRLPVAGVTHDRTLPLSVTTAERPSGHILIVDDEPDMADMLARILERSGYGVSLARSGAEALDHLRRPDRPSFDAIVSDVRMPGITGPDLQSALPTVAPQLVDRTLFITGDSLTDWVRRFLTQSGRPHLEKPVDPADFVAAVDALVKQALPHD